MTKSAQSVPIMAFKRARAMAMLNQDEAADKFNVSRRQLSRYEVGETPIPAGIALDASVIYKQPGLLHWYCSQYCPIGRNRNKTAGEIPPAA